MRCRGVSLGSNSAGMPGPIFKIGSIFNVTSAYLPVRSDAMQTSIPLQQQRWSVEPEQEDMRKLPLYARIPESNMFLNESSLRQTSTVAEANLHFTYHSPIHLLGMIETRTA